MLMLIEHLAVWLLEQNGILLDLLFIEYFEKLKLENSFDEKLV
jgi:hypothetical protein